MKKEKTYTLREIKRAWKKAGRYPMEMPLISKELIEKVTSKPPQPDYRPLPGTPISSPRIPAQHLSRRWAIAASIAALLLVGGGLGYWTVSSRQEMPLPVAQNATSTTPTAQAMSQTISQESRTTPLPQHKTSSPIAPKADFPIVAKADIGEHIPEDTLVKSREENTVKQENLVADNGVHTTRKWQLPAPTVDVPHGAVYCSSKDNNSDCDADAIMGGITSLLI
jgi:hypothetical protein